MREELEDSEDNFIPHNTVHGKKKLQEIEISNNLESLET